MSYKNNSNVLFSDEYTYEYVAKWLGRVCDIDCYMKIILNKLGFKGNITIHKDFKNEYLNLNEDFKVYLIKSEDSKYPVIGINKNGLDYWYQVVINGYRNIDLNMYKFSQLMGDKIYTYEIGFDFVSYIISDDTYSLELMINDTNYEFVEDGIYKRYQLNNNDRLVKYLISINYDDSIFEIYRKICDISKIDKYGNIDLRINKLISDSDSIMEEKIVGMIHLEDGELVSLISSDKDKFVWYDKCGSDTSYIYDSELMQINLFVSKRDNYIDTREKLMMKNDNFMVMDYESEIDSGREQIGKVKKLVRNFFNS